jgi:hypothetical protein
MARMKRGVQHPVPVRVYYWSEGRFETIEAVNFAAAQELVEKPNLGDGRDQAAAA